MIKHKLTPEVIKQIVDFAKKYEPKGDLVGIPREVISVMLQRQYEQNGEWDVTIFEKKRVATILNDGFNWESTIEGDDFWRNTLVFIDFNCFFISYPERFESEPQYRDSLGYPMSVIAQQKELFELMLTFVEDDFQKGLFIEKHIAIIKEMESLEQKNQPEPVKQEEKPSDTVLDLSNIGRSEVKTYPTKPVYETPCGTFTEGEEISTDFGKRVFYKYDERLLNPYICVDEGFEKYYNNGDVFSASHWSIVSKITNLPSIEEVASKAGVTVEQLREVVKQGN